jgi:hypothetical protein
MKYGIRREPVPVMTSSMLRPLDDLSDALLGAAIRILTVSKHPKRTSCAGYSSGVEHGHA